MKEYNILVQFVSDKSARCPILYSWYFENRIDLDYDIIWEETIFTDNI